MKNLMYAAIAVGASAVAVSVQASSFLNGTVNGGITMTCKARSWSPDKLHCDGDISATADLFAY